MPFGLQRIQANDVQDAEEVTDVLTRLFDVFVPGAVFSEPVTNGDMSVITASEVHVGMGLGFGSGRGEDPEDGESGEGGGGGGTSAGRPIAAIVIEPDRVRVEPIVDVTKIALAFFTTLGAMLMTWRAMRRASRRG